MAETLADTSLCTDEDVRVYLNIPTADIPADPTDEGRMTLVRLANAASETFTDESQRLWIVPGDAPQTRIYYVEPEDVARGFLRIEDARAIESVGYGDPRVAGDPTDLASYWYSEFESPDRPIFTRIGFYNGSPLVGGYRVTITGMFGWASQRGAPIPEKVRQAVIYTAAEWYARDVEKFSGTFSLDSGRVIMPLVLPTQVQALAESYRRWRVA